MSGTPAGLQGGSCTKICFGFHENRHDFICIFQYDGPVRQDFIPPDGLVMLMHKFTGMVNLVIHAMIEKSLTSRNSVSRETHHKIREYKIPSYYYPEAINRGVAIVKAYRKRLNKKLQSYVPKTWKLLIYSAIHGWMESFDVLIYGAGPSGSYLGKLLSSAGFKTAVFDSRQELGVPLYSGEMACSSLISGRLQVDSSRLNMCNLDDLELYFTGWNESRNPVIMHPGKDDLSSDCTIDRDKLDKEVASLAAISGSDIRIRRKIESVETTPDGYRIRFSGSGSEEVSSRIFVRADGPDMKISENSSIMRIRAGRRFSSASYPSVISLGLGNEHFYLQDISRCNGFRSTVLQEKSENKYDPGGWITTNRMEAVRIYDPLPVSHGNMNIGSRSIGPDPMFFSGLPQSIRTSEAAFQSIKNGLGSGEDVDHILMDYSSSFRSLADTCEKYIAVWKKLESASLSTLQRIQDYLSGIEMKAIGIDEILFNRSHPIESLIAEFS